jgi:hypothetical protein
MHQGKLNKARRGELNFPLPIGYVWSPAGEMGFDPDEQVQQVVRLIFRKFDELGTLHALLRYLVHQGIDVGVRLREGPAKGTLEWRRPNRMTLQNLLKHPMYAGAYTYGRRQVDARKKHPGRPSTGRVTQGRRDFHVLLHDHVPAYIPWPQYERNLARLASNRNRADTMGAVRHGPSLYGGDYCQYLPGAAIDAFVSQWVLKALEPAALTLSLEAPARLEPARRELDRLWQQRL